MWIGGTQAPWGSALHLLILIEVCTCLRDVTISVPRAVLAGPDARAALRCTYSLEGAALYALRWYRVTRGSAGRGTGGAGGDGGGGGEEPTHVEFYRFVPREHPPHLVFPLLGTTVDVSASDGYVCVLSGLHRRLSGEFACEVSADEPHFHTDIRAANLTVVEPPFRAPVVVAHVSARGREGEREGDGASGHARMEEGEVGAGGARVSARCSSDASYPPANLTWTLDGRTIAMSISPDPAPDDFSEREAYSELELLLSPAPATRAPSASAPVSVKMVGSRHTVWVPLGGGGAEGATAGGGGAGGSGGSLRLGCVASLLGVWRRESDVTLAAPPLEPASRTTHSGVTSLHWSPSSALLLLFFRAL